MDELETYLDKSDQVLVNDWMQVIRLREESEWLPVWGWTSGCGEGLGLGESRVPF